MNTTTDFAATNNSQPGIEGAIKRSASAAHDTVDRMADAAASAQHRVQAIGSNLGDDVNKFVSARPLQSLAGAIALGYLFGRFMR